jgi:hypothetical protein
VIEEIQAFAWGEEIEDRADPVPERWDRAFCGFSQVCFEFCEGHLDGVEVGRVRRQIAQLRPGGLDDASDFIILVGRLSITTMSPGFRVGTMLFYGVEHGAYRREANREGRFEELMRQELQTRYVRENLGLPKEVPSWIISSDPK